MYFYKTIDDNGNMLMLESCNKQKNISFMQNIVEITEEEYKSIMAEIETKIKEEQEQWEQENISPAEFMEMVEAIL